MTGEQFDTLLKLMRGNPESPSARAGRRVLVDGVSQAFAMRETGASRSSVHDSVKRYTEADLLVKKAYGVGRDMDTKQNPIWICPKLDGSHTMFIGPTGKGMSATPECLNVLKAGTPDEVATLLAHISGEDLTGEQRDIVVSIIETLPDGAGLNQFFAAAEADVAYSNGISSEQLSLLKPWLRALSAALS